MAFNPKRLQQARKKAGLTQRELGDKMRVSLSTVRRWEHGENEPTGTELALIARLTFTATDWLLDGPLQVTAAVLTPDEIQFLADFRSANPNTRQLLRECLRDNLRVSLVLNGNGKNGKTNGSRIVRRGRSR